MRREMCPAVPLMAITATATPRVSADIVKQLNMRNCCLYRLLEQAQPPLAPDVHGRLAQGKQDPPPPPICMQEAPCAAWDVQTCR